LPQTFLSLLTTHKSSFLYFLIVAWKLFIMLSYIFDLSLPLWYNIFEYSPEI
jgi:hypothetical protein